MGTANGKAETNRERSQGNSKDKLGRLGVFQGSSRCNGFEQIGTNPADCAGENTIGATSHQGDAPTGKILQRLELVENSYTQYVRAHQARLEARLDESKKLEQDFKEQLEALRQEIYRLATETNDSDTSGNGHYAE